MSAIELTDDQVADLAGRLFDLITPWLADRLNQTSMPAARYVDAAEAARLLGVGRKWVYSNAEAIGGERLGPGVKPRWRFRVDKLVKPMPVDTAPATPVRRRRTRKTTAESLVIRGNGRYGADNTKRPRAASTAGGMAQEVSAPMHTNRSPEGAI